MQRWWVPCHVEVSDLTVVFKSALVPILEPVLRDEYSHITSSVATVYHPLEPHERAFCGETVDSCITRVLPHSIV